MLALCFGLPYAPFVTFNYWSQLTVVRGLADLATSEPAAADLYRPFQFGQLESLGYAFNVLGYAVWGLAGIAIAPGLWGLGGRLPRVAALLFGLTGVLAITGAAGFVVGSALLEVGVIASGITFLASIALAAVLLRRKQNGTATFPTELAPTPP